MTLSINGKTYEAGELIAYVEKLEKENAELKAVERMALYSKLSDQLAKAKEIIKDLLSSCFGYNSKTVNYEVKARAEQSNS